MTVHAGACTSVPSPLWSALLLLGRITTPTAAARAKHLLVDMHELESVSGAAHFVMNPPSCDRSPVLEPDAPWEVAANLSFNVRAHSAQSATPLFS